MNTNILHNSNYYTPSDMPDLQYLIQEPSIPSLKKKAVILMHGVGSNEGDLFALANQLPKDFYVISVRGPFTLSTGRYAWFQVDFSTGRPVYNVDQESSSRNAVLNFVQEIKQKFAFEEIYLGGFSQGAIMGYTIGQLYPDKISGVIALGGRILEEIRPQIKTNDELKKLKVFIGHGTQDNTLPIHFARDAKNWLEFIGVNLSYNEYPIGHQISSEELADLCHWLQ